VRLYSHHSPPPTLPYYHQTQHPPCPLSQATTGGRRLPPLDHGRMAATLRLARGSADSVCLCARRYLYHAQTRPHTRPRTLTTPLHANILHSHLLPTHTAPPHNYLYFGYKLSVRFAHLGLSHSSVRTELPSTSIQSIPTTPANTQPPHALAKYTQEPWLYPPVPQHRLQLKRGEISPASRMRTAQILVQPQSSAEISTLARLRNA